MLFNSDASQEEDEETETGDTSSLMKFMAHLMDNCEENPIKVNLMFS